MALPAGSPGRALHAVAVGLSHRSAPGLLRDRLFFEEATQRGIVERLRRAGLTQALLLSTCDRTEVHAVESDAADASRRIIEVLAEAGGVAADDVRAAAYCHIDEAAIRHLFSVAASLDSAVVGEPHVLAQVKAAHRMAQDGGMIGRELDGALQAAYGAAKRVRSETAISDQSVSIAAAALQLARRVHGDLARCHAVLLGDGEMAELILDQLRLGSLTRLTVLHPVPRRAELTARRLRGHFGTWSDALAALGEADIFIASLASGRTAVAADDVAAALRQRRRRPILLIDAAVPADIDAACGRLDDAFLYDLGDLEQVAMEGRASRAAAAQSAWTIVDAEVARFQQAMAGRAAVPAVAALRGRFEEVRTAVLAEAPSVDAATATRVLVNRLLHAPSEVLRQLAAGGEAAATERFVRQLFRLDDGSSTADGIAAATALEDGGEEEQK